KNIFINRENRLRKTQFLKEHRLFFLLAQFNLAWSVFLSPQEKTLKKQYERKNDMDFLHRYKMYFLSEYIKILLSYIPHLNKYESFAFHIPFKPKSKPFQSGYDWALHWVCIGF